MRIHSGLCEDILYCIIFWQACNQTLMKDESFISSMISTSTITYLNVCRASFKHEESWRYCRIYLFYILFYIFLLSGTSWHDWLPLRLCVCARACPCPGVLQCRCILFWRIMRAWSNSDWFGICSWILYTNASKSTLPNCSSNLHEVQTFCLAPSEWQCASTFRCY